MSILVCGCALSLACTSISTRREDRRAELEKELLSRGLNPDLVLAPIELSPEMRAWVTSLAPQRATDEHKLDALMNALVGENGLGIKYTREYTGSVQEVFSSSEANCLSFTNLFVELAREVGLDAYFLNVQRDPSYDKDGDLVVRWEHVTAGWGSGGERRVLEFGFVPIDRYIAPVRLSDLTALAMFYSNRGAEMLLDGDLLSSIHWLETAVALDPEWPDGWLNLGVARRRSGDLTGAEEAYRTGIDRDPNHVQLYGNLAALLRARGDRDAAGELLQLLDRRKNRNPFAYLALGDTALAEGRMEDAGRLFRRAFQLDRRNAESNAAMGLWELASERPERAREWLEKAERIDPEAGRVDELRSGLSEDGEPLADSRESEPDPGPNGPRMRSSR